MEYLYNYLLITLIRFCTISLWWLTTIWCFGVAAIKNHTPPDSVVVWCCRVRKNSKSWQCLVTDVRNATWNESSWAIELYSAEFRKACCQDFLTMVINNLLVENLQRGGGGGEGGGGGSVQHPWSTCSLGVNSDLREWFLCRSVQIDVYAQRRFKFGAHQMMSDLKKGLLL